MNKKLPFVKSSQGFNKATVYNPAQGFNVSQQIGPLTPPIMGTPGVINTSGGRDFLSIDVSQDYLPYLTQASILRNHLKVITMDRTTMYIPKLADRAKVYSTSEGAVMSQTGVPTTTVDIIAKTMSVTTTVPRELADDANIDIFDMIQEHLMDQFVIFEEESFILGDMSTFAGTGSVRANYDGISTNAEWTSAGNDPFNPQANNAAQLIDAQGNPFSIEHVNTMLTRMKLFGTNPQNILGLITRVDAQAIRGDATVNKQLTNFGPSSVFRTGKIGELYGVPHWQTNVLDTDYLASTTDGFYWAFVGFGGDSPGEWQDKLTNIGPGNRNYAPYTNQSDAIARQSPYHEILYVHKDSCVIGDRQQLELQASPHVALAARSLFLAAHERVGFTAVYRRGLLKVVQIGG